jgi:hypothetical protein
MDEDWSRVIPNPVAFAALQRARAAKRDTQPLPVGSLFDETTRDQEDLFRPRDE